MIMEYQKTINLLDDTTNQPFRFGIRNWVEINEESRGTFNANGYIIFKNSVLRSNVCGYRDSYIHVKGTIKVPNMPAASALVNNTNKKVAFTNYT